MTQKYILVIILIFSGITSNAQKYPFQNTNLSEEERISNFISLLTPEEKVSLLSWELRVPRLGITGTKIIEGLHGLAYSGPAGARVKGKDASFTTTFPQSIGLANTWDPELVKKVGETMSYEARYLAQNDKRKERAGLIILSPNADMGRDVRWGRTEECYGEDAFLGAKMSVAMVKGIQGDDSVYWRAASLLKHFLANSNEEGRTFTSSDFNERLFREYYSYPFFKAFTEGGARCYMTAYNKYNGVPCAVNPFIRNITMKEWGVNGIITTDGGAFNLLVTAHNYYPDLEAAAKACFDAGITMFLDKKYKAPVTNVINKGLVTEDELNATLHGPVRVMLKLGLLDESPENPYSQIGVTDTIEPWKRDENKALVREITQKSVVLLKNENNLLPLDKNKIKSIAVIGSYADRVISDWYVGFPPYKVSVLEGIKNAVGENVKVYFAETDKIDSARIAAKKADVAIVCIGNHPLSHNLGWAKNLIYSEGREAIDRQALITEQEDLVKIVKKANPNTILVMVASFPYAINWSKKNVPAILRITHSSQELGNGLADIIFGKVSPAGRLVQTWPESIDQLLPILEYDITKGRTYMYDETEPLFPFGYGLTYTTFEYSGLKTSQKSIKDGETVNVNFTIKNTGEYNSDEVPQLYVSFPESEVTRPLISLKGFTRIQIPKGETVEVSIPLKADDLKYWDEHKHKFVLEKGTVNFFIGTSSRSPRLNGSLLIK
ncbi:MAG: beta-glucosidase [Chlorobi bacterium]|nr:beta-glucosidase [Chlorobiota bacterium]